MAGRPLSSEKWTPIVNPHRVADAYSFSDQVIHAGVGPVTSFDIDMASSTGASIVAFNVKNADASVDALAKQKGVDVLQHRIIYRLLEEVRLSHLGVRRPSRAAHTRWSADFAALCTFLMSLLR